MFWESMREPAAGVAVKSARHACSIVVILRSMAVGNRCVGLHVRLLRFSLKPSQLSATLSLSPCSASLVGLIWPPIAYLSINSTLQV